MAGCLYERAVQLGDGQAGEEKDFLELEDVSD
jgi:hypothetical protein